MSSSLPKNTLHIRPFRLILGVVGLVIIAVCAVLYIRSVRALAAAEESNRKSADQIRELTGRAARSESIAKDYAQAAQNAKPESAFERPWLHFEIREALLRSFPFTESQYQQIRELAPDLYVAVIGDNSNPSVWLLNLKTFEPKRIDVESYGGDVNRIWLRDWSEGLIVVRQSSPGEALADELQIYLNRSGMVVAETEDGTFHRTPGTMDARFGGNSHHLELVQKAPCKQPEWLDGKFFVPTTTLIAIKVDGRSFPIPTELETDCALGYGDSIGDVLFPAPSFDGKNVTFRLPGYDGALSSSGTLTYRQRSEFVISQGYQTIRREDRTGSHVVAEQIFNDPLIKEFEDYKYSFTQIDPIVGNVRFLIQQDFGFERERVNLQEVGTVEYNLNTRKFENLSRTMPTVATEGEYSPAEQACSDNWSAYVERLRKQDKAAVAPFEVCAKQLNYPFATYPVPGTGGYIGFVGNYVSNALGASSPICTIDGQPQKCVVYRVENGIPTIFEPSKDGKLLTLLYQPLAASNRTSLVLRRFPYEVCSYSVYETYDFTQTTTTGQLIDFSYENNPCAGERDAATGEAKPSPTTLTFQLSKTRSVQVTFLQIEGSAAFPKAAIQFQGKPIATIEGYVRGSYWGQYAQAFPAEADLATYALQKDKTKFFFSVGDENYTLNLSPAVPVLTKR